MNPIDAAIALHDAEPPSEPLSLAYETVEAREVTFGHIWGLKEYVRWRQMGSPPVTTCTSWELDY